MVFLRNVRARCKSQEPENPHKPVHSFATSTFIYHWFSSPDIICTVICSGSLGMQLDCWHLVPRADAVNVSCLVWMPSLGPCSRKSLMFLGSQILNVFSDCYPVFTEKSQFSPECLTLSCCFWISVLELNGQKCQNQTFLGTGTFMSSKEQL